MVIEGATAPLGVTCTGLALIFILVFARKNIKKQPVVLFFFIAFFLAAVLFIGWGIYWKGLPEFSQTGIIK